ncbi:MAG: hypothetical protein JW741_28145 [Sedimentisphaerales bacterium]|nr:hypothetical protein [Sedimentisphaerales bacterium]
MAKRCIGIDIGTSHLRAVQIARTPDGFLVEKEFGMQTRRSTDSPVEILRALPGEHEFDRHADIVVSLPYHAMFFAGAETDAAGVQALRAGEVSILKDDFPIPGEDILVQVCSTRTLPRGDHFVQVAATSIASLEQELRVFQEARMPPGAVDTSITALRATVAHNHPEIAEGTALILYVDESALNLTVLENLDILMVRNIPVHTRGISNDESLAEQVAATIESEVEITWRKAFGANPDAEMQIYLACARETAEPLAAAIQEKVEGRLVVVDPCAAVQVLPGIEANFPIFVAEGLALRMLSADQTDRVDFLAVYNRRMRPRWNAGRQVAVCAALLAVTAVVWFAGLLIQLSFLEKEYAHAKQEIENVFRTTLPEEKNIVSPLAQLQQKLDAFQNEYELLGPFQPGRLSALTTLDRLSSNTPAEGNLVLDDVLVAADSVRVMGSCDSFATLSQWQQRLEEMRIFDVVDTQNQKKDAQTGKVHFTLSLSSARTEQ